MQVNKAQLEKVAILGGTFIAGTFFGWAVAKRKLQEEFSALAAKETFAAREFYKAKYEKVAEEDAQAVDDVEQLVLELQYTDERTPAQHTNYNKVSTKTPEVVVVKETVVVVPDEVEERLEWDYEFENGHRDPSIPYVIHRDEFENARHTGNSQVAYTFYEDDSVLVDEGGSLMTDNMYMLLGEDTLQFGHGSEDPMVVFVRNERIQMDFEVTLVRDSYAHAVQNLEPETELRHSQQYRGRRRGFED